MPVTHRRPTAVTHRGARVNVITQIDASDFEQLVALERARKTTRAELLRSIIRDYLDRLPLGVGP